MTCATAAAPLPADPRPADPCHASVLRMAERDDADALSAELAGWNQHYDQMTAGRFRGTLQEVRRAGVQLFREYTSAGLRQSGRS